ncbi:MAG: DUF1343 domain-containing protein [Saprospiraceae bacterium]
MILVLSYLTQSKLIAFTELVYSKPKIILPGAYRMDSYLNLLDGKRVGLVVNQSSKLGQVHLVDTLLAKKIQIVKIFAPEHGFRGDVEAGGAIENQFDLKTGLPIVSIYGKKSKPSSEDLKDVDCLLFDIQDVGVRFFTYISTLHYVMEACAENGVPLIVLDRPNPNGFYVDGPVLDSCCKSFIGVDPIPIVYGMTIGELAKMIKGEAWIKSGDKLQLKIIPCSNYSHKSYYELPINPSPNLKNQLAVLLYPSLCFFEGTSVSLGRGTDWPFLIYGHPLFFNKYPFSFTPLSRTEAINPPWKNQMCFGNDLRTVNLMDLRKSKKIQLKYLIDAFQKMPNKDSFFLKNLFFDKLAGTTSLRKNLIAGNTEAEIRKTWQPAIKKFMDKRKKYLLYEDF